MSDSNATSDRFWANRISPQLNALWRGAWRPGRVEAARYLYDHELVLITEGSCTVHIANIKHELKAGHYIIIPPGIHHVTTTRRGVYRNCIHFDWREVRKQKPRPVYCYHPERPKKSAITRCPSFVPSRYFLGEFRQTAPVISLIETLFHRWQTGEQISQALCRGTFLEILILLMHPTGMKTRGASLGVEHACAVRDLLDQRSESDDSIQSMLGSLGFSYPHLCRLFRSAFGITPVEYRNALRLERAKTLLSDAKLTISEIAYQVGFKDAAYFSRQFRKQNGVSPKQLRKYPVGA